MNHRLEAGATQKSLTGAFHSILARYRSTDAPSRSWVRGVSLREVDQDGFIPRFAIPLPNAIEVSVRCLKRP